MTESKNMTESATGPLYDLWSKFYDYTFGRLVHKRHLCALEQLHVEPGQRVLDLGVGTGMTLEHYPANIELIGMDLSAGMLDKAEQKRRELGLDHVQLIQADAMAPPLAERSFDQIVITHTVSVVSDPPGLMQWAQRLIKPGGTIIVLNHFRSPNRVLAWLETVFNPIFVKIGWRSDLSLEESLSRTTLKTQYRFKPTLYDLWQIVVLSPPEADHSP